MNDKNRTMVAVLDEDGDLSARLLLTDDQIRLLEWLKDNEHIDRYSNFQILYNEIKPIAI